jgi:hypothetical protein
MIGCIIIAEEECNGEVFEFETQKEAAAFCTGVHEGAGLYGCGSCKAYTLADLEQLDSEDDAEDIAFIEQYLRS